jgi:hypothetical protein
MSEKIKQKSSTRKGSYAATNFLVANTKKQTSNQPKASYGQVGKKWKVVLLQKLKVAVAIALQDNGHNYQPTISRGENQPCLF